MSLSDVIGSCDVTEGDVIVNKPRPLGHSLCSYATIDGSTLLQDCMEEQLC